MVANECFRFPRREDVDRANHERMARLGGQEYIYVSTDGGAMDPRSRETQLGNFMAPKELKLKIDAQVFLPILFIGYNTDDWVGHDDQERR